MKINEIISESAVFEDDADTQHDSNIATLISILTFLQKRGDNAEAAVKMRTQSLLQLVQNAGATAFDYNALVAAHEKSDAIKTIIKNFNKDSVVINTTNEEADDMESEQSPVQNPEDVVDSMAKKAAKKRE